MRIRDIKVRYVLLLILLIVLVKCSNGQMTRDYHIQEGKMVYNKYANDVLTFTSPLADHSEIQLSVSSDSISERDITFKIFAIIPQNINIKNQGIVLFYENGTEQVFQQSRIDEDNYVEYTAIGELKVICKKKVTHILFRGIGKFPIKNKNYFVDIFKCL